MHVYAIGSGDRPPIPSSDAAGANTVSHSRLALATALYMAGIVCAEACTAFVRADLGIAMYALVLAVLVNHHVFVSGRPVELSGSEDRGRPEDVLLALALVPLLRILSLTMPISELSQPYAYVFTGVPLLLATLLAARAINSSQLWTRLRRHSGQGLVALTGIPLGLVAYVIIRPQPIETGWVAIVVTCVGLVLFSAAVEELLFRGVLQNALYAAFGPVGVLGSPVLFAAVYLGARPVGYAAFAGGMGLLFTWFAFRTRSLLGVVLSHAIVNLSAVVIWPGLIG